MSLRLSVFVFVKLCKISDLVYYVLIKQNKKGRDSRPNLFQDRSREKNVLKEAPNQDPIDLVVFCWFFGGFFCFFLLFFFLYFWLSHYKSMQVKVIQKAV